MDKGKQLPLYHPAAAAYSILSRNDSKVNTIYYTAANTAKLDT
jgi:hypothetical protein